MCFSANASFGSGVILVVIGIASLKKVEKPSQVFFAGIPLIFAIHQISEGFVWLSLNEPVNLAYQKATTYSYLFIAQVIWPVWTPLSIALLETKSNRRKILNVFVGVGVMVSAYLAYCLFTYQVDAKIISHHIAYTYDYPRSISKYSGVLYVAAVVLPSFFSSRKLMWTLGATALMAFIVTRSFYPQFVVSVWCFFAAIISFSVLIIMRQVRKEF